jgi:hypothetical protein
MKKLLLLTAFSLLCNILNAQPWMPVGNPGPVKFSDIVAGYPKHSGKNDEVDEDPAHPGKMQQEGTNYLFDRWAWYWGQHLDQDGYIVPPMKNLTEWQKYLGNIHQNNGTSRTTSASSLPSDWVFQGPNQSAGGYSGLGRINVVAFDPIDSNTFYIGSAAGSTWKTTNGGNTWAALYDNFPTLGVSDIKINPRNHNTIYVATGDGDAGDAYSSGVIKSYDGGNTWHTTGLNWPPTYYYTSYSLLINPVDTNTMILSSSAGIFISHNAGNSWTNVSTYDVKQILYNPRRYKHLVWYYIKYSIPDIALKRRWQFMEYSNVIERCGKNKYCSMPRKLLNSNGACCKQQLWFTLASICRLIQGLLTHLYIWVTPVVTIICLVMT